MQQGASAGPGIHAWTAYAKLTPVGPSVHAWTRPVDEKAAAHWLLERGRLWRAALTGLFMLQVFLGYALMLIVMTYQFELVISAIVGLGLGHATFNLKAPVGESVEPCCVEPVHPLPRQPGMPTTMTDLGQPLLS